MAVSDCVRLSHGFRIVVIVVVTWLLILPFLAIPSTFAQAPSPDSASTADPRLAEIKSALKEWSELIVNVSVKYRTHVTKSSDQTSVGTVIGHVEWARDDIGREFYHQYFTRDGDVQNRSVYIWNNDKFFWARYPRGESAFANPSELAFGPVLANSKNDVITPFYGLWIPHRKSWLPQLLDTSPVEILEPIMIDKIECPQLRIKLHSKLTYLYVLDPRFAFLPRTVSSEGACSPILWMNFDGLTGLFRFRGAEN